MPVVPGGSAPGPALWHPDGMATLLVVHHSPTRATRTLTDAALAGAGDDLITGVTVLERPALQAGAEDVLAADAVLLGTPANFGYMSGALKHFFDSTFLQIGGALGADGSGAATGSGKLPYGLYVHGRYDTTGAVRAVQAIVGALPWRQAAETVEVMGDVTDGHRAAVYDLGATLAALLSD